MQEASGGPLGPLDIRRVMASLPHRYPMLLVDRVEALVLDQSISAIKAVTINEGFFAGHFPTRPIMPGVLILEALAQTGGILIAKGSNLENRLALIASIDGVKIRRPVVPGDQLTLSAETIRLKSRSAEIQGFARVGGQLAAEARIRFVLVEG